MDTKNQPSSKIPAVRTYAGDLELERKAKNDSSKNKKLTEVKLTPNKEEKVIAEIEKKVEAVKEKEAPLTISVESSKDTASHSSPITVIPEIDKISNVKSIKDTSTPKKDAFITENQDSAPATIITEINKISNVKPANNTPAIPRRDTFITENQDSGSATIITDAKHNRFKLIPAIKASIRSWFTSKKDTYQAKKIPKYTISETSMRKGVIQKATSITGKLATSDFSSIHERIRNRNENEKKAKPTTTWSANTEPGFLLLEEPDTSNVTNVQMISKRSFRTVPQEIRVTEINHNRKTEVVPTNKVVYPSTIKTAVSPAIPTPITSISEKLTHLNEGNNDDDDLRWHPEKAEEAVAEKEIVNVVNQTTKEETISSSDNLITTVPKPEIQTPSSFTDGEKLTSETPDEIVPVEVSKPVPPPIVKLQQIEPVTETQTLPEDPEKEVASAEETSKKILSLNTNILTLGISGVTIAIILIVGTSYFWVTEQIKSDSNQVTLELPMLIDIPLKKIAGIDDSKESLLQAFTIAKKENNEAIQVVFLSSNPNHEPISVNNLLSAFDIFLEQNFAKSISDIRLGTTKDKQPFAIIRTAHETAAKGGLLMWENGMYEDLAEILLIEEKDPVTNTKFIDASIDGIDVRVLKDKKGDERLIYGFTKDTIIITTKASDFSGVAKLIK